MICKDCIHYNYCKNNIVSDLITEVPNYAENGITDELPDIENRCKDFNHKDKFIELPLCIGQDIWQVYQRWNNKVVVTKGKVSMLQQKADKSWKFRMSVDGSVIDFTIDAIGDYIFLTEEDAKAEADEIRKTICDIILILNKLTCLFKLYN